MLDTWAEFHVAFWLWLAYAGATHARTRWQARAFVTDALFRGLAISTIFLGLSVTTRTWDHHDTNMVFGNMVLLAAWWGAKVWLDEGPNGF